jgi:peptidoglycan/xylan/chitin deacetylase (PgdA/CDA1 family)
MMTMLNTVKGACRDAVKVAAFGAMATPFMLRRRLQAIRNSGLTTILNLHRVAPDDRSDYRPLDPSLFHDLLAFVKREFAVVTIGQLKERTHKPKLVLSFDDGYRDFALNAVPILRQHGLKANQNIIPRCVETGLPPLNVMAQDFVGQAPPELVRNLKVEGFSGSIDRHYGARLSHFLKMRPQAEQDSLAAELLPQFQAWDEFQPTPMMTLDDVRALDEVELGAHSYAHSSMEYETDQYLDDDVRRCAAFFEEKLGQRMTIYAFPNGSCREGQAERVLDHGVDHVLLVGESFDRGGKVHHRFTFDGRSPSEVRFKALGGRAPA